MAAKTEAKSEATCLFNFDHSTPGTFVMKEVDEHGLKKDNKSGAVVGSLYLRKDQQPNGQPKKVIAHFEFIY